MVGHGGVQGLTAAPCLSASLFPETLRLRPQIISKSATPVHLVVDRTGLKIFDEGEWPEKQHKTKKKRRSWRKLHLGLDLVSGQIVCSDLTTYDIGDPSALPSLLNQINAPVDLFLADGSYNSEPTVRTLSDRCGPVINVTIPPPKNAILSHDTAQNSSARDRNIVDIAAHGQMVWQTSSGDNQKQPQRNPDGALEGHSWLQTQGAVL